MVLVGKAPLNLVGLQCFKEANSSLQGRAPILLALASVTPLSHDI